MRRGGGGGRRRHGSVRGHPNHAAGVPRVHVHVHVHVHAHVHVHVDVVGARQARRGRRHGAGRVVHAVVAVAVHVGGQRVIRVRAGPVGQHAAAGLVRAVEDLVDPEADGLVLLLVRLAHLLDPGVLHG